MLRLPNSHPERQGLRIGLLCCAALVLSCAPSQFDKLTGGSDPATCEGSRCADGGASESGADAELDAEGARGDVDADLDAETDAEGFPSRSDAAAEDVTSAPPDATAQDAPGDERIDGAGGDGAGPPADAAPQIDAGPCGASMPVCEPQEQDPDMEQCGLCKSGLRRRTRNCAADGCSWGAWSAWSECADQHVECDPNVPAATQQAPCTTCGTRTQSRSCSPATCTWEPWKDVSACSWCNECSEVVYCDTPSDIADRGTWCRQKACSAPQALANCMEDAQSVCGGIKQPFFMEYL